MRIAETASSVGYESEATFSRVFKRFAGAPTGAWRRLGRKSINQAEYRGRFCKVPRWLAQPFFTY